MANNNRQSLKEFDCNKTLRNRYENIFFVGIKIRIFLAGGTEAGIYSYGNARKPLHKTDLKLLGQARGGFSSSPFYFVFLRYGIHNLNLKSFYNLYHPISVGITIMELTAMKMKLAKNDRPKFS